MNHRAAIVGVAVVLMAGFVASGCFLAAERGLFTGLTYALGSRYDFHSKVVAVLFLADPYPHAAYEIDLQSTLVSTNDLALLRTYAERGIPPHFDALPYVLSDGPVGSPPRMWTFANNGTVVDFDYADPGLGSGIITGIHSSSTAVSVGETVDWTLMLPNPATYAAFLISNVAALAPLGVFGLRAVIKRQTAEGSPR